jgi:hypothetical protein
MGEYAAAGKRGKFAERKARAEIGVNPGFLQGKSRGEIRKENARLGIDGLFQFSLCSRKGLSACSRTVCIGCIV